MNEQIRIGHYILGKTIGTGGFAKVKIAKHDLTGLDVAVKIINKKKMKNGNMISKVKRQIKILKFINHPNIIKLYEVLDTTNDIFVITELARKGELYDNIQQELSEVDARFYFNQIVNGVEYIHRNHICHRDLKPENILIDQNNLIKIGDFGLSNLMKDGKPLKTSCGSPFYAAPEIVYNRKYEGTSVDIWSCGVILYALIVGYLPFDDDNITLLYKKIEKGAYTIPSTINRLAEDLIRKMLEVDPCRRITIPEIKAHPWMQAYIPLYMKIPAQFVIERESEPQIDEEVLNKIQHLDLTFHDYTEEKVRKAILKRDDQSFAIAYELLKSQKDRKIYVQDQGFRLTTTNNTILSKVQNTNIGLPPPPPQPIKSSDNNIFIYGKVFEMHPKVLADKLIDALAFLNIQFQVKNSQYCIKCVYHPRKPRSSTVSTSMIDQREEQADQDGEYCQKRQRKFTKSVIKFTAQIYEINRKTMVHVLDLHLTQGHTFMFFPIAAKLYEEVGKN